MSYEFTKLSDVPVVNKFPIGANAIIETNGQIKRCPSVGDGSSGGSGGVDNTFVVTGYYDGSAWSDFSATYAQILAAYNLGKVVELHWVSACTHSCYCTTRRIVFWNCQYLPLLQWQEFM